MSTVQPLTPQDAAASTPSITNENHTIKYILVGILVMLLIYVAYQTFLSKSSKKDKKVSPNTREDDPVIDFNLRESITEINELQNKTLRTLSTEY